MTSLSYVPAVALFWLAAGLAAPARADTGAWRQCTAIANDNAARLACFDRWAQDQRSAAPPTALIPPEPPPAHPPAPGPATPAPQPLRASADIDAGAAAEPEGCRDPAYSELSRFWELEPATNCGTLGLRGYRPISIALVTASNVNRHPGGATAPAPAATPYRRTEARLQLSVRTKLAHNLLTRGDTERSDSLWFGYTQQSYWQVFTGALSRPFRTTDHEPEFVYVYPTRADLPLGWRWRYSGVGVSHQSNGQSDPLSRSWNRAYLMAGLEHGNRWQVQAKLWQRLPEDALHDDNPGISGRVGRGEISAFWNVAPRHTLGLTLRSSLSASARGSARLEWLQQLGGAHSGLRLHTQLFSGYGDSLMDYNRKRTVFSMGLSLVDF